MSKTTMTILAVVAVGGVGWYLWRQRQQTAAIVQLNPELQAVAEVAKKPKKTSRWGILAKVGGKALTTAAKAYAGGYYAAAKVGLSAAQAARKKQSKGAGAVRPA
jgi:hypothetical protein